MSDELEVKISFSFTKGNIYINKSLSTQNIDVSGDHLIHKTQEIGFAAAEALDIGEITTVGWGFFRNLDTTNYLQIGYDDSGFKPTLKLKAGEYCVCRLGQDAPYAQADTAAVDLEYILFED